MASEVCAAINFAPRTFAMIFVLANQFIRAAGARWQLNERTCGSSWKVGNEGINLNFPAGAAVSQLNWPSIANGGCSLAAAASGRLRDSERDHRQWPGG